MHADEVTATEDDQVGGRTARRVTLERSWILAVVAFTVGRFVVAYGTLDRYGVNIWVFGLIDIVTAVPYGVSTARLAGALVDRRMQQVTQWGIVASISFLAPYLYLAWCGRDVGMPMAVYVVLAVLVICFGTNAAYGVSKRVRAARLAGPGGPLLP